MRDVERLAAQAARGDRDAFAAVCRAHFDDVWRYCRALAGSEELAEDVAQDTFLRAAGAIHRFRGDAPVRVWLLAIARRAVADALRRERGANRAVPFAEPPESAAPDSSGRVDLDALIAGLPPALRHAFVLTQIIGLSYDQAAAVLGTKTGTIRSRVYRARDRLVAALADDDLGQARSG